MTDRNLNPFTLTLPLHIALCQKAADRDAAFAIRAEVFVAEQSVPIELEMDEYDDHAVHYLAQDANGVPVGTLRIVDKGNGVGKIGRVAVRQEFRNRGVGWQLMDEALHYLQQHGYTVAALDAQVPVIGFYERLGFGAEGPIFDDAGIPHRHMERRLKTMTLTEMRSLFPSVAECIHLNHAGTSPIARPVADAVQTVCAELMGPDSFAAYMNHLERQEALRATLGRMLHVAPTTLALVRNTSHGLAIVAQAIPFQPGDIVVVAEGEYPANVYPWLAQAHRGVQVQTVPLRDGMVHENDLIAACEQNPKTRALTVSWVQWGTGQRLDLQKLGDYCRASNILFVVDMVQGFGALQLDAGNLPIDFATAGCHKWLLAPGGVGVLYVRPEVMPTLLPTNIGWNSVRESIAWERLHYDELKTTPDRFEEGTPGLLAVAALKASVDILESVGFGHIERQVLHLSRLLQSGLRGLGMNVLTPSDPAQASGIVAFRHPHRANDDVLAALKGKNIVCAVRCGNVRFAPHAYLTDADCQTALAALSL